jgi:phosphatidate cytidylyltransferase
VLIRIATSIVGIPILVGLILIGNPYLKWAAAAIALIGVYEFYHLIEKKYKPIHYLGYGAAFFYFLGLSFFKNNLFIYLSLWLFVLLIVMLLKNPKYSIIDIAITFLAPIYIAFFLSAVVFTRDFSGGEYWIGLIFISAWGSDTCAYLVGVNFGKHKLAPILSPNKTIEGSIGGLVGAGILAFLYTLLGNLLGYTVAMQYQWVIIAIAIFGAAISQLGDLVSSAMKREFNQKDFGFLFPGHGGVLDRFDSILLVAPYIMIAVQYMLGEMK